MDLVPGNGPFIIHLFSIFLHTVIIDTEATLSPSKERCLISGGKNYLIPDRHPIGSSNLSPQSLTKSPPGLTRGHFSRKPTATSVTEGFPPLTIIEAVLRAPPRITTAPSPTPYCLACFRMITYPVGTDASRRWDGDVPEFFIRLFDRLRKVSDFWRAKNYLIPDRHTIGCSNLSPESLPNHHLALHGDIFPENPSTLSQTQPQTPSPERDLVISRARIKTVLSELGIEYIKRAELYF
ncbi:hypothetical protein CEXT_204981 [Caerostris extrusa]|uniref:Uncharacterized protein n=1 Tax=Caerostris extrusa TaxID=172846 RepID=A0AAV4XJD5_CAEEX|nr:hypothetical protein CEXT_204981 [Caerostris extrusa]